MHLENLRDSEELLSEIFKYNPIIAAQASNNYIFEPNFWLGHTLIGTDPREDEYGEKGEFVGEKGYVSFQKIVEEVKDQKKLIINFGDSSTSGWDSDQVNNTNPLFQYKTYSDVLRDLLHEEFVVVNAGIPGHSSLQGLRRAQQILQRCKEAGIAVDYATLYFGNNDSVCNGNIQEKDALPSQEHFQFEEKYQSSMRYAVEIVKIFYQRAVRKELKKHVVPRVFLGDYKRNQKAMIDLLKQEGVVPLLIEPLTPLYWMPGRRVAKAEKEVEESYITSNSLATKQLWQARGIYETALQQVSDPAQQREALEKALELDRVCPRIPKAYLNALQMIAKKEETLLIRIPVNHSKEFDEANFVDYTHPRGELNTMIANGIAKKVAEVEKNPTLRENLTEIHYSFSLKDSAPSSHQRNLLKEIESRRSSINFHDFQNAAISSKEREAPPNMYTVRMSKGRG